MRIQLQIKKIDTLFMQGYYWLKTVLNRLKIKIIIAGAD